MSLAGMVRALIEDFVTEQKASAKRYRAYYPSTPFTEFALAMQYNEGR
jgi:hypothetical protein